jgi:hypothetical protein
LGIRELPLGAACRLRFQRDTPAETAVLESFCPTGLEQTRYLGRNISTGQKAISSAAVSLQNKSVEEK